MKKNYFIKLGLLFIYIISPTFVSAQSAGDIAFIAFNADSNDEFSFVALVEWDGMNSFNNTNEGEIEWSHTSILPAGSIVAIAGNGGAIATLVSGFGTVSGNGINLNTSNETIYALLSEPITTTMDSPGFLAGCSNDLSGDGVGDLTNTGLTVGTNFINFDNDNDGFKYIGDKSLQTNFSDYLPLIMDKNSWQIEVSDGTLILPIDGTSFIINNSSLSNNEFYLNENNLAFYPSNGNLKIIGIKGQNVEIFIYNLEGQHILTSSFNANDINSISLSNINTGIYIVQLQTKNGIVNKKIFIE